MTRDLDINTLIAQSREVNMARGVDLQVIKDKRLHQHRWIMTAAFALPDDTLEQMMANKQIVAGAVARGKEIPQLEGVPLPMGQENLVSTEGPGCVKCNAHWENPDAGYGKMCPVNDRDWEAARMQQHAALEADQRRVMDALVEQEKLVVKLDDEGYYDTQDREPDNEGLFDYDSLEMEFDDDPFVQ